MREVDFDEFSAMLEDVVGLYPKGSVTGGQKAMFFRALAAHPIAEVRAGFDAHVKDPQRGRFVPLPADILAQIEGLAADDGRPGVEEAWAASLRARDEAQTIVWTGEMAQAWADARLVLDCGDEIGARMAFKEVYGRLVNEARRARRAAVWTPSLGFDATLRDQAITQAAAVGRLPPPDTLALPAPASLETLALAAPADVREKLLALRRGIVDRANAPSAAELDRQHTQSLKADAAAKVAEFEVRV